MYHHLFRSLSTVLRVEKHSKPLFEKIIVHIFDILILNQDPLMRGFIFKGSQYLLDSITVFQKYYYTTFE